MTRPSRLRLGKRRDETETWVALGLDFWPDGHGLDSIESAETQYEWDWLGQVDQVDPESVQHKKGKKKKQEDLGLNSFIDSPSSTIRSPAAAGRPPFRRHNAHTGPYLSPPPFALLSLPLFSFLSLQSLSIYPSPSPNVCLSPPTDHSLPSHALIFFLSPFPKVLNIGHQDRIRCGFFISDIGGVIGDMRTIGRSYQTLYIMKYW